MSHSIVWLTMAMRQQNDATLSAILQSVVASSGFSNKLGGQF